MSGITSETPPAVLNGMLAVVVESNRTGQMAFGPDELQRVAGAKPDEMWDIIGILPERIAGPSMDLWAVHYDARSKGQAVEDGYLSPPPPKPKGVYVPAGVGRTDLRSIPAERYVAALTGVEVRDGRKVRCVLPSHEERTPSFSVRGTTWRCFGCSQGGTIFDLAAAVWGRPTGTKAQFADLARELERRLR